MSSRLACWLHGHPWGRWEAQIYGDLFGNDWQLRHCTQCGAEQRRCVRSWSS